MQSALPSASDLSKKEWTDILRGLGAEDRVEYRRSAMKMVRGTFLGLKLSLGWKGGLQNYCGLFARNVQGMDLVQGYKNMLAPVLPSTFIFHRGALDLREEIAEGPTNLDVGGISVQADHSE